MSVFVWITSLSSFEVEEAIELSISFSLSPQNNICQYINIKLDSEYPLYIRFTDEDEDFSVSLSISHKE